VKFQKIVNHISFRCQKSLAAMKKYVCASFIYKLSIKQYLIICYMKIIPNETINYLKLHNNF